MCNIPKIIDINGPVVKADSMGIYKVEIWFWLEIKS